MVFDVLTGICSVCFLMITLLYPFRRKVKLFPKIGKLKFHCIAGFLFFLSAIIHINTKLLSPFFSAGYVTFFALTLVVVTGILKRRFMKNKLLYYSHIAFVGVLILAILIHVIQQILNLLIL
ncbi:MAG: hypothetical protein ABF449_14340 [Ethanoligenens sp.]|uniref:hypothetical protein n=1 Tax=Ethanoligenens sp. TaxID=2099655 RepID=UPI0039EA82D1